MLDIGWQELFIVAVVAIVIVGPKELPRAIKGLAALVRKARALAREFQGGIDDLVREAELDDLKNELTGASPSSIVRKIEQSIDPTGELKEGIRELDPTADVRQALEPSDPPSSATTSEPDTAEKPAPEPKVETEPKAKRRAGGS